jgi:hypothetical protein
MVHFTGRTAICRVIVLTLVCIGCSSVVHAQIITSSAPRSHVGFHAGVSVDPEQTMAGVWWQTPPIGNRFHLRPGLDGGFGNDLRVATINIDFIARFPLGSSGWHLVQGGGPVIVLSRIDGFEGTDIGAGGSYIFGFAQESGFFGEFRIGGGSVPALKMSAGWSIGF